jgi:hypothetical protein
MIQEERCWRELEGVVAGLPDSEMALGHEMRRTAVDYAMARARWQLSDQPGRAEQEKSRSLAHDCFIDAVNALSRACARHDLSQDWRRVWGTARTGEERRRIGDFACYIAYGLMLNAR